MSGPQSSILRKAYVDDIVCILPFPTGVLKKKKKNLILSGGRGTYILNKFFFLIGTYILNELLTKY